MLKDIGRKEETGPMPMVAEGKKGTRISYPGFSLRGDSIPEELAKAQVGDMCRCEIIIKKTADSIDTYGNQEPRVEVEVHKLGYLAKAGKKTSDEYLKMPEEERTQYDKEQMEGEDNQEDSQE